MSKPYVWPLSQLLEFLEQHKGTVIYKDGAPALVFPPETQEWVRKLVTPHIRALRVEVMEYFYPRAAQFHPDRIETPETPQEERTRLIRETEAKGRANRRKVYYLKRNGLAVEGSYKDFTKTLAFPKRTVRIPLVREATHVCVEGGEWIALPKVTTPTEDGDMKPQRKPAKWKKGIRR